MEIFKNGNRTYLVFPKEMKKADAVKEANNYFKERADELAVVQGKVNGDVVVFGSTMKGGNAWVVFRKGARE